MRMVTLTKQTTKDILENLLKRSPGQYGSYEAAVKEILEKVREEGDRALFAYTKKFDRAEITEQNVQVTEEEIREAYEVSGKYQKLSRKTEAEQLVYFLGGWNHAGSEGNAS